MSHLSRRDVLKLSAALLGGAILSSVRPLSNSAHSLGQTGKPNFIVLVLDAMSARNLSLIGYPRRTTAALEKFSQRSTVYHNHYAGGNFTTPGTATIFTGVYPWTHRALNLNGLVARSVERNNIFNFLGAEYTRVGFSQNQLAYLLLAQIVRDMDLLLDRNSFSLHQNRTLLEDELTNDPVVGYFAVGDFLGQRRAGNPGSVSLELANIIFQNHERTEATSDYPRGYPFGYRSQFRIEDVLGGLQKIVQDLALRQSPFFSYFHLLPPHSPYNPREEFIQPFMQDGMKLPQKPMHPLTAPSLPSAKLDRVRLLYDSFVSNVDYEVGNFIAGLESAGILDSTCLIITSDHGEMFERGFYGHGSPLMYDPVNHIPLIVHMPGQMERRDVYSLTSNADLLPTILSLAGREIPSSVEGRILPGLGGTEDADRSVFTVYARDNSSFLPLKTSVLSARKNDYHIIHYRGYPGYDDRQELYHLGEDPDELRDLATEDPVTVKRLLEELLDLANQADTPYHRKR